MRRTGRLLTPLFLAALVLALGRVDPLSAQKKPAVDDSTGRLPLEGFDKFSKEYRENSSTFRNLAKGETTATKANTDIIDLGAKWHVYRFTWNEITSKPGGSNQLVKDFELIVNDAVRDRKKSAEFLRIFSNQMHVRLKEVLSHHLPLVRINVALLLPHVARMGNPDTAELLANVLSDTGQNEAVRYWAIPALRELFGQTRLAPPLRLKDDQEARCIIALNEYLARPPDYPERILRIQGELADEKKKDSVSDEEKKDLAQYEGGIQLARRATARALAETRFPAVHKKAGGQNVPDEKGLTALSLVRLLANDVRALHPAKDGKYTKGTPPKVTLGEQVESAIGICQLQSALTSDYAMDYAAHHVGRFLVEFATRSNTERNDKREPWRLNAGRLLLALTDLQADLKNRPRNDPGVQYAEEVIKQATGFLRSVESGADANSSTLGDWLRKAPPNKSVYKSLPNSVAKVAEAEAQ